MPPEEPTPQKDPVPPDEDWKQRVKAEAAALDAKFKRESAGAGSSPTTERPAEGSQESGESAGPVPVPPADFSTLVAMFSMQAMVALGAIPNPATGKHEAHLELARHFVNLLGVVEEKTKGNLTSEEAEMLSSTLHHLRIAYIEQTKKQD